MMDQNLSFLYESYNPQGHHQSTSSGYGNYVNGFSTPSQSSPRATANNYHQNFSYPETTSSSHFVNQSVFHAHYNFLPNSPKGTTSTDVAAVVAPIHRPPPPHLHAQPSAAASAAVQPILNGNTFPRGSTLYSSDNNNNGQQGLHIHHEAISNDSAEDLDIQLNDLPLESLLRLTQHERQLIDESEVEGDEDVPTASLHLDHQTVAAATASSHYLADSDSSLSALSPPHLSQALEMTNSSSTNSSQYSPYSPSGSPQCVSGGSPSFASVSPNQTPTDVYSSGASQDTNMMGMAGGFPCEDTYNQSHSSHLQSNTTETSSNCSTPRICKKTKLNPRTTQRFASLGSTPHPGNAPPPPSHEQHRELLNNERIAGHSCNNEYDDNYIEDHLSSAPLAADHPDPDCDQETDMSTRTKTGSNGIYTPPVQPVFEAKKNPTQRKRLKSPRAAPGEKKICGVCGDNAKNKHFGGMACDSCKAFFRRSVQSQAWEQFKCDQDEQCVITKTNRRGCQYCRFMKCQNVGMQMRWVMTESDRMVLMKNRLAKTRQAQEEREKDLVYGNLPRSLDPDDAIAINRLLDSLHTAFKSMPYPQECSGDTIDTLSNIFVFLCKRFGKFYLKIKEFHSVCEEDRPKLLKNGIAMSLYVNGAHLYDAETQSWPAESTHEAVKVPRVTLRTLQQLANLPDAFSTVMRFYHTYQAELKDHAVAVLMYLISFFIPDEMTFKESSIVQEIQEKYIALLRRYLIARDGLESVSGVFLKLIDSLSYIKDILRYHAVVDIKPTINLAELSAEASVSFEKSMQSFIDQIQLSLQGNFPEFASILGDREELALIRSKNSHPSNNGLMKRSTSNKSFNHPETVALFGSTCCTDMIITHPMQNLMEWNSPKAILSSSDFNSDDVQDINNDNIDWYDQNGNSSASNESDRMAVTPFPRRENAPRTAADKKALDDEHNIEMICNILQQLSHTEDRNMINILKKNIPVELFERFSDTLTE